MREIITGAEVKKLLDRLGSGHQEFCRSAEISRRYYENQNDIKRTIVPPRPGEEEGYPAPNPLRQANNRVSHRWHGLLVDQKASYAATYPPLLDLGEKGENQRLLARLGDEWPRDFHQLAINAANDGVAWVHVWEGEGGRECAPVEARQIIPVYGTGLRRSLSAVLRMYSEEDGEGTCWHVVEYWDNETCTAFRRRDWADRPEEYCCFPLVDLDTGTKSQTSTYAHGLGEVPFIEFPNNNLHQGDLWMVKDLVDIYDRVDSGYANDIEDIQQLIFIITNYGGENLSEFLGDLKRYKAVKIQDDGVGSHGGVSTLAIDIPVEARNSLLELLQRLIFLFGQGVNPDPEKFGNSSGVALQFLYSLLELKAGAMETEFRPGIARLCRLLLGLPRERAVNQAWTRNAVKNETEQADIIAKLAPYTSQRTIDESSPLVSDADEEEKRRKADEQRELERQPPDLFPPGAVKENE